MEYYNRALLHGNSETVVLALIAKGENYPYQLRRDIREEAKGRLEVSTGLLYTLLQRMEKQGLVKSQIRIAPQRRERRCYTITALGRKTLADRVHRWRRFTEGLNMLFKSV